MPPAYIPSVRARRLARSLREYREAAGLTMAATAASFGWSTAKVGHIESCRNKASVEDVALMLGLYGVSSPASAELLALASEAERRNWWTDYVDLIDGPYIPLEDAASEIDGWAPQVIPGLLQTQDYAREIFTAAAPDHVDEVERWLKVRMLRQTLLTRAQDPPRVRVVLDEAVLERPIGGADVMRDQLYRLAADARRPNVTIQILPKAIGTHAGLEGGLIVLRFAEPADPDVGYHEGFHGATYLERPQQVARCNVAMERLRQDALTPQESAALIDAAAKR
jgi:transcriptional regulator with XRE-family HTH domain